MEPREELPLPAGFELIDEIGRGGSGIVYAVRWQGKKVALKVPQSDLGERDRTHFLREATLLQKAAHRGVVEVLDAGTLPDGRPYLMMPLLGGESLAAHVARRGKLPAEEAIALFLPLAEAVAHLHAMGLAHRDIKAENVYYLEEERRLVLLDFGIARETDAPASTTTQANVMRGTPATMAPERFFGARATASSDVYELALVLYTMLVGALPWGESTDASERLSPRSPAELGIAIPDAVERAILEALSTRPERRPTAQVLIERLSGRAPNNEGGARVTLATRPPASPTRTVEAPPSSEAEAPANVASTPETRVTKATSIAPLDRTTDKTPAPLPRASPLPLVGAVVVALGVGALVARAWPASSSRLPDAPPETRASAPASPGDHASAPSAQLATTAATSATTMAPASASPTPLVATSPPLSTSPSAAPATSAAPSARVAAGSPATSGSACHQLALYDCAHNPTASKEACNGLANGTLDQQYSANEEMNCTARLADLRKAQAAPLPADADAGLENCARMRDVYCSPDLKREAESVHHPADALRLCSTGQSMYDNYKSLTGQARSDANNGCANMLPGLATSLRAPFESMRVFSAIEAARGAPPPP